MADETRPYPRDLRAERAVLGGVLVSPDLFDDAAAVVRLTDFHLPEHGMVWDAMARLRAAGHPIDIMTVQAEMQRAGTMERFGGLAALAELVNGVPRASNVAAYARIVREMAGRRAMIAAARQTIEDAYDADATLEVLQDRAAARVSTVDGFVDTRGDFVLASDWMLEVQHEIERMVASPRAVTGVTTGLPTLDEMLRGLQRQDVIYIGARPSAGKTSLLLQMALAASEMYLAGIISAEMSRRSVGIRAVSMDAGIPAQKLFTGFLSPEEQIRAARALAALAERRLAIDDGYRQSAQAIASKARRLAKRFGVGVLFVDYMQLLSDAGKHENRNHEIAAISAGMKGLAKELDIPVVVLSQLTRESARGERPTLHSLRDSGALEQDADVVLLLHRPEQHQHGETKRYEDGEPAEIIVAKQRNGPTGVVRTQWHAQTMRFVEARAAA